MSKRLSLILAEGQERHLEPYLRAGTNEHRVLLRWAAVHGVGPVSSEAAALRVLLRVGVAAMQEGVLDEGYAELAQVYHRAADREERRAAREHDVDRTEAAM